MNPCSHRDSDDPNTSSLLIHSIAALKDNYIWIVIDPVQHSALIVDPGESLPVMHYLQAQELTLAGILITHHHADHTHGIMDILATYPVPVIGPEEPIRGLTRQVAAGDEIRLDAFPISFKVLSIPGHTLGHVAFYSRGLLFCGDTLFASGCGRIFEGTAQQMYASLEQISALPDDTQIYCAHEYTLNNLRFAEVVEPRNEEIQAKKKIVAALRAQGLPSVPTWLKEEKKTNPFLRCERVEIKESVEQFAGRKLLNEIEVFTELRKWKDGFK